MSDIQLGDFVTHNQDTDFHIYKVVSVFPEFNSIKVDPMDNWFKWTASIDSFSFYARTIEGES